MFSHGFFMPFLHFSIARVANLGSILCAIISILCAIITGGYSFPNYRVVILCLGLLNAVLLIAAVVLGVNCEYGSVQKV